MSPPFCLYVRVLVVEDDVELGRSLVQGLAEEGLQVDLVTDADEAVAAATTTPFDVILLDVMIPRGDGFSVCADLRRRQVQTPLLMLTARDALEDRVRGLQAGADDYLVKPFAFQELVARVRALARRHLVDRRAVIEVGELRLDTQARTITAGGTSLSLTAKEMEILEYFMHNPERFLSREQIEEHAWNYDLAPASNLVEVYVGRIRRKLRAAGVRDPISTRRGRGYRLARVG